MANYPDLRLFIAGDWRQADAQRVVNPADESVLGIVPHARRSHLDDALSAAEQGFKVWSRTAPAKRAEAVRLMRERVEEMAIAMTLEQGKPIAQSRLEILRGCDIIEWDAQKGRRIYGRIIPSEPGMRHSVLRQPIGVVAAFSPWNFPIAARQGMRALLPPDRQIAGDALELLLGHQWPDLRLRIAPVTDAQRLAEGGDTADELIVDLVLDEQARAGAADLPGIGKHGHAGTRHRLVQIGIGEHDVRRFAAEFQRHALQVASRCANDRLPVRCEPVNATLSTSMCAASAAPAVSP
jgi:hypothetical protein